MAIVASSGLWSLACRLALLFSFAFALRLSTRAVYRCVAPSFAVPALLCRCCPLWLWAVHRQVSWLLAVVACPGLWPSACRLALLLAFAFTFAFSFAFVYRVDASLKPLLVPLVPFFVTVLFWRPLRSSLIFPCALVQLPNVHRVPSGTAHGLFQPPLLCILLYFAD